MSLTWLKHPEHGRMSCDDSHTIEMALAAGWEETPEPTAADIMREKGLIVDEAPKRRGRPPKAN